MLLGHRISEDGIRVYTELPDELTLGEMTQHKTFFRNMMLAVLVFPSADMPSPESPLEQLRAKLREGDPHYDIFKLVRFERFESVPKLLEAAANYDRSSTCMADT